MAQMRVFVSHSHEDDAFYQALVAAPRQAQAEAWSGKGNALSGLGRFAGATAAQQRAKELGKPW